MDTQYADTQIRLDKVSIDKNNICGVNPTETPKKSSKFIPPTIEEVKAYCQERKNKVDSEKWYDFYSSKGWMIGKNKMKDWKAAVRTWEHEREKTVQKYQSNQPSNRGNFKQREYKDSDLDNLFDNVPKDTGGTS
jgi:hypothetical protein